MPLGPQYGAATPQQPGLTLPLFPHLYLSFDRWVNKPHTRREVQNSARLLGELITLIKLCFSQTDGNGWNIPKMHALAKMPKNMLKFGSANNFCGQIGERALKDIVKDHAQLTQR